MFGQEEGWLLTEKYKGKKSEAFFTDLARLQTGEPLAYLIGSIPFLDCTIYLDSRPLIPRTETEYWTEALIKAIKTKSLTSPKVLDLCAGSGAIGVAVAHNIPEAELTFIELEDSHLETIKKNCLKNDVDENRVKVLAGDLFSIASEHPLGKFDFIASNPPYINPELSHLTEESVKSHEPALALYGGIAGMELINKIIQQAPEFLNPGGQLWLEHEPEQVEAIIDIASARFTVNTHKDQYQISRFTELVLQ